MSCARSLQASNYRRAAGAEGKCRDCEHVYDYWSGSYFRTEYDCALHKRAGEGGVFGSAKVSPRGTCDKFKKKELRVWL